MGEGDAIPERAGPCGRSGGSVELIVQIVLMLLGSGTVPDLEPDPVPTAGEGGDNVRKSPIG